MRVFLINYSGLNLNQDKATKPQTVQIVRQGEATPYWFKVNPLYIEKRLGNTDEITGTQNRQRPSETRISVSDDLF